MDFTCYFTIVAVQADSHFLMSYWSSEAAFDDYQTYLANMNGWLGTIGIAINLDGGEVRVVLAYNYNARERDWVLITLQY